MELEARSLEGMLEHQHQMQIKSFGADPASLDLAARVQFLKDMILALEDELHEAMGEFGWKPWSERVFIDENPLKGELIDAWHFFMNLCIAAGLGTEEWYDRYYGKAEVNRKRQVEGYDNTNKCSTCRRALDEPEENLSSD